MTESQSKPLQLKSNPNAIAYRNLINGDPFRAALTAALPKHLKVEHFIRVALAAMQRSPKLFECSPESVLLSLMRAAAMGLEPDGGVLGHGYLVPYWNSKTRKYDCQFIPGYRGLIRLAHNSGDVADVWAEVAYEKDLFSYELGLEPKLQHKRNDVVDDPGPLRYAYAVARFRDGERKFVVLNKRDIDRIKSASASRDKSGKIVGPWLDWESEMWKKSAVRRLCKMLPLSVEVQREIETLDPDAVALTQQAVAAIPSVDVPAIEALASTAAIDIAAEDDTQENGDASEAQPSGDKLFDKQDGLGQ
jgi:recombination protein RecT